MFANAVTPSPLLSSNKATVWKRIGTLALRMALAQLIALILAFLVTTVVADVRSLWMNRGRWIEINIRLFVYRPEIVEPRTRDIIVHLSVRCGLILSAVRWYLKKRIKKSDDIHFALIYKTLNAITGRRIILNFENNCMLRSMKYWKETMLK